MKAKIIAFKRKANDIDTEYVDNKPATHEVIATFPLEFAYRSYNDEGRRVRTDTGGIWVVDIISIDVYLSS